MTVVEHAIGGKLVKGSGGRTGPIFNPATGVQTGEVGFATKAEVDCAVNAARKACISWRTTSLAQRTKILFRIRELLVKRREEIGLVVTAQHGKVLADAVGEVARGIENVEYACGLVEILKGSISTGVASGIDVASIRQPVGVVAGISPFNFPAMVPLWMLANAIACGNAFVLKPSEKDPGPAMCLAEILSEAGVPDGVFNVIHGDRIAVEAILDHPGVDAVSFVGSTAVARSVYQRGTAAGKRVQALGSAKNHMVVLPDAHLDGAATAAVSAAFGSAGERCMAVSVVVAVGEVADPLLGAINKLARNIVVGPGTAAETEMGPLITLEHRDHVASSLGLAEDQGAVLVLDGRRHPACQLPGFYLGPSVIDGVRPDMDCYKEEIFGPVLLFVRTDSLDDALALVNANRWGNGAAIFTRDGGAARRFQLEVEAGMVGVNVAIPVPIGSYSFGGWKESLFGPAHIYGPEGVAFYTRGKVVTSRWPDPAPGALDFGFDGTR